jgi:tRNA threonylcarbamoyladenosine biosynthesis protein TsaB
MSGPWLALDTGTELASVAAGHPPVTESGAHVQGARRHAAEVIRLVDFALSRLRWGLEDLDGIVVGDGPGSFTGLRIGWATAKGLVHERGLELRAIPSLMAAAAGAGLKVGPEPVAACFDALRGHVYGALYVFHPDRVETLVAPTLATVAELERAGASSTIADVDRAEPRYGRPAEAQVKWEARHGRPLPDSASSSR